MGMINRVCLYCGKKMYVDIYKKMPNVQAVAYCDNDDCPVKPCTDATSPSRMYAEILAITRDTERCGKPEEL